MNLRQQKIIKINYKLPLTISFLLKYICIPKSSDFKLKISISAKINRGGRLIYTFLEVLEVYKVLDFSCIMSLLYVILVYYINEIQKSFTISDQPQKA